MTVDCLSVRKARIADLASVLRLVTLMHDEDPASVVSGHAAYEPLLRQILRQPGRHLLVAAIHDDVVGTADMVIVQNLSRGGRPWAVVENVVVEPSQRRRGIARALMLELIDRATQDGCYKLELVSAERRLEAHRLYEGLGFDASVRGFRRYLDVGTA